MTEPNSEPTAEDREEATLYQLLGGASAVRRLVDRFYDLMDQLPEAAALRALHPGDLTQSRQKLYEFLSGWLGGPPLYTAKRGPPRLRARHMPFAIDEAGANAWMRCMDQALAESDLPQLNREVVAGALRHLAHHMRNVDHPMDRSRAAPDTEPPAG